MIYAIIALAFSGLAAVTVAGAMAVRKTQLEGDKRDLRRDLLDSNKEHETTIKELATERSRAERQLEFLRDEINDQRDLLATCTDPDVILDHFDRVLQKATGRLGGQSDGGLL